jgi:hypothetical protein
MTKPTTNQHDKITPSEFRDTFQALTERLDQIEAEIAPLRDGLAAAASPASLASTAPAGETVVFEAVTLLMSYDDNGQPVYKVKGGQYMKFGVRIWPEVLPILGLDSAALRPGPNPVNLRVRAIMGEHGPRKVIGLA